MHNKKYFNICVIPIIVFVSINIVVSVVSNFFIDNTLEDRLTKYQISKIKNKNNYVKNIFLGDSSLGNAINAEIFEKLSGKETLNLALWGNASFAGAYALLENINITDEQNIFIISSLDVWRRPPSDDIYHQTVSNFSFNSKINFTFKNIFNYSLNIYRLNSYFDKKEKKEYLFNDYIVQRENVILKKNNFQKINYEQIKYLNKIFNFCDKKKINCLFVHGPIFEEHCQDISSLEYINNVIVLLKANKIKNLEKIFCMKKEEMGDSDDHINPKFKDQFTKNFYNLLLKQQY